MGKKVEKGYLLKATGFEPKQIGEFILLTTSHCSINVLFQSINKLQEQVRIELTAI